MKLGSVLLQKRRWSRDGTAGGGQILQVPNVKKNQKHQKFNYSYQKNWKKNANVLFSRYKQLSYSNYMGCKSL